MKYSLVITQTAEGESNTVAVDAEGVYENGTLVLNYQFDGAAYRLEIGQNAMSQTRGGDVNLSMFFAEGKTTAARLFDGTNGGEFPLYTHMLKVRSDGADCKAECEFSYGEGGEKIYLSVAASILQ